MLTCYVISEILLTCVEMACFIYVEGLLLVVLDVSLSHFKLVEAYQVLIQRLYIPFVYYMRSWD